MRELAIVGCGGHGRETLDVVEAINGVDRQWRFAGFVDDAPQHLDRVERRHATVTSSLLALCSHTRLL